MNGVLNGISVFFRVNLLVILIPSNQIFGLESHKASLSQVWWRAAGLRVAIYHQCQGNLGFKLPIFFGDGRVIHKVLIAEPGGKLSNQNPHENQQTGLQPT